MGGIMGLYNKSFCKLNINLDELTKINEDMVTNGLIYRYRDMILKKYWYCTEYAINEDVFNKLCIIDNNHFIKLYELFTIISDDEYDEKFAKYKQGKINFSLAGYTAKYYQPDFINPLLEKSAYLINSIEGLKELVDILSNSKIMMDDTKIKNTIIQKNGIVIIDPDYYKLSNKDIKFIKNNNNKELLQLLKTLFIQYSVLKKPNVLRFFTELDNIEPLQSICYIEKELRKVKRPIDLLNL